MTDPTQPLDPADVSGEEPENGPRDDDVGEAGEPTADDPSVEGPTEGEGPGEEPKEE